MARMTKAEAIRILIEAGGNDCKGSGLGFRATSEEWRDRVSRAARRLWKDGHGYDPDQNALRNYGLRWLDDDESPA